jgi:acyl-CoA thioester hydrolase
VSGAAGQPRADEPVVRYTHPLRIYWEDTDAGGVVFYANYLKFFERARTEWLRACGFEQERLRAEAGVMFVVADTQVRYLKPARLDDVLHITVAVRESGRASMRLSQVAWRGDERLCEGEIRIGCVDALRFAPKAIPQALRDATR